MKNKNIDFMVYGWMRSALNLNGIELLLFSLLWHFNKVMGCNCKFTFKEYGECLNVSWRTAVRGVERLKQKGLIHKMPVGWGYYIDIEYIEHLIKKADYEKERE